jgi:hypothetical protein
VPCAALCSAEYLATLEERALAGYGLYHPQDARREGKERLGVRGSAGRREGRGLPVLDTPPPAPPPPAEGVLDVLARCAAGREPPPEHPLNPLRQTPAVLALPATLPLRRAA